MMRKHPSAPAYANRKKTKPIPISVAEYDEIHRLWESGMTKKMISDVTGRSTGTICYSIIHLTREEVVAREEKRLNPDKVYVIERKKKDLSSLPATELFNHSRDYIF